jgi:uncharacterized protein (TIGR02421 family)
MLSNGALSPASGAAPAARPARAEDVRSEPGDGSHDTREASPAKEGAGIGSEPQPSAPHAAPAPWRSRKEIIAALSGRILEEQRPIHVLQALRWEPQVEEAFRAARGRELPRVDADHWARVGLGFDPEPKMEACEQIARDAVRDLGEADPIGRILVETATGYRDAVRMLCARGTRHLYRWSRDLYGSPKDLLPGNGTAVRDIGRRVYATLTRLGAHPSLAPSPRDVDGAAAAQMLAERLGRFFDGARIGVIVDDDMLADATAGSDYVKVRAGARFSQRDVDVLEVHEGWVHVATSLNGQEQPVARWLAKGPPRTTAAQEGLAAMMEILTGRCHVQRAQKLNNRILAVDKAEDGASFLDVHEWYRTEGYDEAACFGNARRVFRGGVLEGGAPFTKDVCYGKGLALGFELIRGAAERGEVDLLPMMFAGKLAFEDVPVLRQEAAEGTVRPPRWVPPIIADLQGLASLLAFSSMLAPPRCLP